MSKDDYQLCYVDGDRAYFTSDLKKQWGDDWSDVPYQCNAGEPYRHRETDVIMVLFYNVYQTPDVSCRESLSVEGINKKFAPWLKGLKLKINAGTTLKKFKEKIKCMEVT